MRPIKRSRICATKPAASPIATAITLMKTTRPLTAVVRRGVSIDSSVGPMDGAIGKPSVDDESAILWSVTVEPVSRSGVGLVGGGPAFISVSDSR